MRQLVSNWILTSCQPREITSGRSNSDINKCAFQIFCLTVRERSGVSDGEVSRFQGFIELLAPGG